MSKWKLGQAEVSQCKVPQFPIAHASRSFTRSFMERERGTAHSLQCDSSMLLLRMDNSACSLLVAIPISFHSQNQNPKNRLYCYVQEAKRWCCQQSFYFSHNILPVFWNRYKYDFSKSFQELYQISATGETDNLKATLIKLQEENRKLRLEYEVSTNNQPGNWVTCYLSTFMSQLFLTFKFFSSQF